MREFLKGLDFDKGTIDTIMAEHGKLMTESLEKNATLAEQLRIAKDSLSTANTEIERFKGMDIDGIQQAAADYQTKYEEAERNAATRIAEMEYSAALRDALAGEKFTSEYARLGVLEEIKTKKLPIDNGVIVGLADIMTKLRTEKPDAFVLTDAKAAATATFSNAGATSINGGMVKEDYAKMGYAERLKLKTENPTLYDKMKG